MLLRHLVPILFFSISSWAAHTPHEYVHVEITPRFIQDMSPRFGANLALPRSVKIHKTPFFVKLDIYFVPGNILAPVFVEAKYNVQRMDGELYTIITGAQLARYISEGDYARKIRNRALMEQKAAAGRGERADFFEPSFRDAFIVISALARNFDLEEKYLHVFSSQIRGNYIDGDELALALSLEQFTKPLDRFLVQFRIAYENYDFAENGSTIRFRRFFEGRAEKKALSEVDIVKLTQLIQSTTLSCEENLNGLRN